MDSTFWLKQTPEQPLFPEIDWSRPESKQRGGRLLIIGGNEQAFRRVAQAYEVATQSNVGEIKVAVPDSLELVMKQLELQCEYLKSNASGGIGLAARDQLLAYAEWADAVILAGDLGRNSETPQVLDAFLGSHRGLMIITADSVEAVTTSFEFLLNRPETLFVVSLAQLQNIFKETSQMTAIASSMGVVKLVDVLHELTATHQAAITTFYEKKLITAIQGQVCSTPYNWDPEDPAWRVAVATKQGAYWMQHAEAPFKALAASQLQN